MALDWVTNGYNYNPDTNSSYLDQIKDFSAYSNPTTSRPSFSDARDLMSYGKYENTYNAEQQRLQGLAKANGDINSFTSLGGKVDPNDPWGFYRQSAGAQLANTFMNGANDPTTIYKNKLQQMSTGTFSPDDPSYQFRFNQGLQANERSLAARGLLNSGNAAIELQDYGQQAASQEYGAQFQRMLQGLNSVDASYNNQFNRLSAMAGINLNPATSGQLQNQAVGNMVQANGQQLNYQAQMANINQRQNQWEGEMGLYNQYNQGLGDTLSSLSQPKQQAPAPQNSYSTYSQPIPSQVTYQDNGTLFGNYSGGDMAPGQGYVTSGGY